MAFQTDMRRVPYIADYKGAKYQFERAHKWRDTDWRGLGSKRQKQLKIGELRDGSIACRFHNTDVVVYHPDGSISVDLRYDSRGTREFAHAVWSRRWMYRNGNGVVYMQNVGSDLIAIPLKFTVPPRGEIPRPKLMQRTLDKKLGAKVRKEIAPLLERVALVANNMTIESLRATHFDTGDDEFDRMMNRLQRMSYNYWRAYSVEETTLLQNRLPYLRELAYDDRGAYYMREVSPVGFKRNTQYAS